MSTSILTATDALPELISGNIPPPYTHQEETRKFLANTCHAFDTSDPGTGKTRGSLSDFADRRAKGGGPALVLAPKSILEPAWAEDILKFFPKLTYSVAHASNRAKAFELKADIYITNHDAVAWVDKNWNKLSQFHGTHPTLIVDESTAYKNPQAQRSKALQRVAKHFEVRRLLSGTPNPNSILELWHQAFICDDGERLGRSYWKFRNLACEPVQTGPQSQMVQWRDKPGIEAAVYDLLSDITIRHKFEDCLDIKPNTPVIVEFTLSDKARRVYDEMHAEAISLLQDGEVVQAVHAASKATKLLQIASGAVYQSPDEYKVIDTTRYELILDLIEQRKHSVCAFLWRHQRDQLVEMAKTKKLDFAIIDGSTSSSDRSDAVKDFQAGKLRVLFAHPQSAGHGLTLTKGTATIWSSPTYNSEHFEQFNRRIYRAGQTEATQTIHVLAKNTIDQKVRARLNEKLTAMQLLLDLMET